MEMGYSAATKGIFPNGAFDLIDYFYKDHNAKLATYLENLIKEGKIKRKNELCRDAIIYRLKLTQPYLRQWTEAMAIIATRPTYVLTSLENLMKLCDEIWYQLGDTSTDVIKTYKTTFS
jgi:rpsU-divergently transcribed protein